MGLAKIKSSVDKLSKSSLVSIQTIWDMYFFEHFLCRIGKSEYNQQLVFKGGFLLESILGVELRTTMDIDLKMINVEMTNENLTNIFTNIASINCDDEISYKIISISEITKERKYAGKSIKIEGKYYNIKKTFHVDVAMGDIVTPNPVLHKYSSKISKLDFEILAYSKETILAEKLETVISKGLNNSRSKDLLDIYLLVNSGYDSFVLNAAIINTFFTRKTLLSRNIYLIFNQIKKSERIKSLYENYVKKHSFAKDVSFDMCMISIDSLLNDIDLNEPLELKNIEITLVRHGQDEVDKLGGWSDNHLTEIGVKQVNELTDLLTKEYDLIVSSDLNRAIESAYIINNKLNVEIVLDNKLRETNNGLLRNMTKEQFNDRYPGLFYSSLMMDENYPEGESPNEFYYRVKNEFLNLVYKYQGKKILIVTHGGVISVIQCIVNGWKYSNLLKISPPHASLIQIGNMETSTISN